MRKTVRFAVVIVLLLAGCQNVQPVTGLEMDGDVRRFGAGEARFDHGIALVKVAGAPYEMGLQYGVLLREEMAGVTAEMQRLIDDQPWYVEALVPLWIEWYTRRMQGRVPERYLEEIRGMADGSGQSYRWLMFLALGAGFVDTSACTAVLASDGDRLLHGRNFDWGPLFLARYPVIVECHPAGRKAFTGFGFVSSPGLIQGVNQDGLSLTTNIAFRLYDDRATNRGMPIMYRNREVMEQAGSLDEAEKIYRALGTDEAGWMITLGSASENDGAIIEMYDGEIVRSGLHEGRTYVHNILFNPQRLGSNDLARRYAEVCMGLAEYNLAREAVTRQHLAGLNSVDSLLDYLGSTGVYGHDEILLTDNSSINNEWTINTLVFDVKSGAVYYAAAPGFSGLADIWRYDLDERRLELYRPASARIMEPAFRSALAWFESHVEAEYNGSCGELIRSTDFSAIKDPAMLMFAASDWLKAPESLDAAVVLAAFDRLLQSYPEFGILYLYKGRVLEAAGDKPGARAAFRQALAAPVLSPEYRMDTLLELHALDPDDTGVMTAYVALVDEAGRNWKIEERYAKPVRRMKKRLKI